MLKYLSHSVKGLQRKKNQDRVLIIEKSDYYLFLIFDGVSSLSDSYLFIDRYKRTLRNKLNRITPDGKNLTDILFESHCEVLKNEFVGMSTLAGLFYSKLEDKAKYINIGDSRLYIFTNQFLEKITEDHSLSAQPNVLTKCLGIKDLSIEDFELKEIEKDYNFLLCTDGFYHLMSKNLKEFFNAYNFKKLGNIEKKLSSLQYRKNKDDSSYILIKHEIPS
jgi:serine/threonine protein phosphatase PrpC